MVSNALAAAAVGLELGIPLEPCASALAAATVAPWRMETFETAEGFRVLNDAYNANPESMAAALRTAAVIASGTSRKRATANTGSSRASASCIARVRNT
jgi:UDP-N-acetylmuramoyl-tripeptide--D-alanyl-D-alanine ligase